MVKKESLIEMSPIGLGGSMLHVAGKLHGSSIPDPFYGCGNQFHGKLDAFWLPSGEKHFSEKVAPVDSHDWCGAAVAIRGALGDPHT